MTRVGLFPAVLVLAFALGACAPQTVISNQRQAVIESWSASDAVALAEKECARTGRWPMLDRQAGSEFWFSCHESDDAQERRREEAHAAALRRAEELRQAMVVTPAPATPPAPVMIAANVAPPPPPVPEPEASPPRGIWVQVGAFRDRAAGTRFLAALRKTHGSAVKDRKLVLTELNSTRRGLLHLARLGPFPDMRTARRACAAIKARGTACFALRQR